MTQWEKWAAFFRHFGGYATLEKHPRTFSSCLSKENLTLRKGPFCVQSSALLAGIVDYPLTCHINMDDIYEFPCAGELYLVSFSLHLWWFCYHGETIFLKLSIIKYLRIYHNWAIEKDRYDKIKGGWINAHAEWFRKQ